MERMENDDTRRKVLKAIVQHVRSDHEGLDANKSKKAVQRVAMAMGVLSKTTGSFDDEVGVVSSSGKHSEQS